MKVELKPIKLFTPEGKEKIIQIPCEFNEEICEWMMTEEGWDIALEEKKKLFAAINNPCE